MKKGGRRIMNYVFAFSLTLFAGLSTTFGVIFAFNKKIKKETLLPIGLGISAGVMIYVSFVEIIPKSFEALNSVYDQSTANFYTTLSFFLGIGVIALIDYLIPKKDNPHEYKEDFKVDQATKDETKKHSLMRLGIFSAIAIALHNFPEGLATFIAALKEPELGISIAIAIAIHNIPEGISIAIPIYQATGSKKKAFWYTFFSGFAEPLGALIGYLLLNQFFSDAMFGFLFAGVGGIMVYISLDELLPTAERFGKHHLAITGVIIGMIIMAISLLLF
jgi:ZIP family zinc transporter